MKTTTPAPTRLQKVLNGLEARNFDFTAATSYAEPGYDTDKPLILLGNWNSLNMSEMNAIESVADIQWSDEWEVSGNGEAFRVSPDSYGWEPCFTVSPDGEYILWSEIEPSDFEDLGLAFYPGDSNLKSVPSSYSKEKLESVATKLEGDFQTGFHPGQTDSPEKVLKSLPMGLYFFRIADKGQFDITWEVWQMNEE